MKTLKMKRSLLGVTLLEIMLVLAIAAMVIVMSVRYYQSSQRSQQVNAAVAQVQGITATVESLVLASGDYANTNTTAIANQLSNGASANIVAPWGGNVTYAASTPSTTGFVITYATPADTQTCAAFTGAFTGNNKFTVAANCSTITYTK